jgi:hypothetical protein
MIMPGHNEIHYCPQTLRAIIEKHINSEALQGNATVTMLAVKHESGSVLNFTVVAHVTTDAQPKDTDAR